MFKIDTSTLHYKGYLSKQVTVHFEWYDSIFNWHFDNLHNVFECFEI